ncbi:MAG: 16S rRNA (cytidine(1402)-2'-O)-methyltransferase [Anaerolineae bacterium]
MTHTLYVVGTPIGNLEDVTPRALRVLAQVGVIASENPGRTHRLLDRYDIETPMIHFTDAYDRRKEARLAAVLDALARGDVALVSEAGMPLLADPGYELVQAALAQGIEVVPVPGPTALAAALGVSGLCLAPFSFLGFAPRKSAARRALFGEYVGDAWTLVVYESPSRLLDTLHDARAVLGDRQVAVACELTKLYEQVWRGTLGGALLHFQQEEPRGEYVIVIDGGEARLPPDEGPRETGGPRAPRRE